MGAIPLTIFSNENGKLLTKQLLLDANGRLSKDSSACVMVRGIAMRIEVVGVAELGMVIEGLAESQALSLGVLREELPDKVRVVTKKMLMNGATRPDVIARTAANIFYRGPAFALIDYDSKGMPVAVTIELKRHGGFWPALLTVLPALDGVARLTRSSTSAGLSRNDTGEALPGSDGIHVYLEVRDGDDIVRFLKALHNRCWLMGLGWFVVSSSGQLLDRSIVDRMVGQASRLVFEGGPGLKPPLVQDKECRRPVSIEGAALDTAVVCPPLSIVENARLEEIKDRRRALLAPEVAKARSAFIERQAERLVKRTGLSEKAAARIVLRQCEGVLRPDMVLPFDDPDLEGCTVADVLADPERFEGETLADPLENDEPCKAVIMRYANGVPWIHSFAHGRTVYTLQYDAAAIRKAMEAAVSGDVMEVLVRFVPGADVDAVELEALRQLAKERSGTGLQAIKATLKAAIKQHATQQAKAKRVHLAAVRQDPRPLLEAPYLTAPWLPEMGILNEVIGAVVAEMPPIRNINDDITRVRTLSIPNMHAFTGKEDDDD